MNFVFANHREETAIYPLIVRDITEAQTKDKTLEKLTLFEKYKPQLIEDIQVLLKDDKLVIPKELQMQAVEWYHHYLQHQGTTCLEETLCAAMYWRGMQHSVGAYGKKCHKCQVNKRCQQKYGNYLQSWWFQNPGKLYVLTSLGHTLSKVGQH